jgi:hypothetical protein
MNDPVLKILRRAKKILTNPKVWLKNSFATTGLRGRDCEPEFRHAKCFCLLGALERAEFEICSNIDKEFNSITRREIYPFLPTGHRRNIASWNDSEYVTHKAVLGILRAAIRLRKDKLLSKTAA